MQDLFASPGMTLAFAIILIIQALSLLILAMNVQLFRSQSRKYRTLLSSLGDEAAWGNPGRLLLGIYVVCTIGAAIVTTSIFFFQPHLL